MKILGEYLAKVKLSGSPALLRYALLVITAMAVALIYTDFSSMARESLSVGDVAKQTVEAQVDFQFIDEIKRAEAIATARASVQPVYRYDVVAFDELLVRVGDAMSAHQSEPVSQDVDATLATLSKAIGLGVSFERLRPLVETGVPDSAIALFHELVIAARDSHIVYGSSDVPVGYGSVQIVVVAEDGSRTIRMVDEREVLTLEQARARARIQLLESRVEATWADSVGALVAAAIRPNVQLDTTQTALHRSQAEAAAPIPTYLVKEGTILFRQGDVITAAAVYKYEAMLMGAPQRSQALQFVAVTFFVLMLFTSLYHFGVTTLKGFSNTARDLFAVSSMLITTAALARITTLSAPGISELIGLGSHEESVWFLVPVAGAAIVVRLLVGVSWAVLFSIVASALVGLVVRFDALIVIFYLVSSVVAAGGVSHTRERMAVVRAGLMVAVANSAVVLLIYFVRQYTPLPGIEVGPQNPMWAMLFAALGGAISVFFVLGALPMFEAVGFVTDYRLMELSNLNHPLLRQLVERAPGSYHHSVIVGSLAEAGCEAVGANPLHARVAAYYHDIGKSLHPSYFVENQRDGYNRHDSMDPKSSARMIIGHVTDGLRLAHEHGLPKPIIDNIAMHHGTGLLSYFYNKAVEEAGEGQKIDPADFRYPGPKPRTKEAGVIMIADKVEAASRTIKHMTEPNVRAMIGSIINSVLADGQFKECPLTFKEIHEVIEVFVAVLMGIYHRRIEYAETKDLSRMSPEDREAMAFTLELPTGEQTVALSDDERTKDYESITHLPDIDAY
jgi:putative nucleotidyltransferase with HDIG domain